MLEYFFEDSEFGRVSVFSKRHARHIIFRVVNNSLRITSPVGVSGNDVQTALDNMRERIRKLFARNESRIVQHVIDGNFRISTNAFDFRLSCCRKEGFRLMEDDADSIYKVVLEYPENVDFCDKNLQQWLEKVVIGALQRFAGQYLLRQLEHMSQLSGLNYEAARVGHAKTRWGTCRRTGRRRKHVACRDNSIAGERTKEEYYPHKITLSVYTALLPENLTGYIILHELTHTRHPDHSAEFHATLDRLTQALLGLTEKECINKMHSFHTDIFCFADRS